MPNPMLLAALSKMGKKGKGKMKGKGKAHGKARSHKGGKMKHKAKRR